MTRQRSSAAGPLVMLVLVVGCALPACEDPAPMAPATTSPSAPRRASLQVAGRNITVELAYSDAARERGLKHRTGLDSDHGMLFLFVDEEPRLFWMRDTLIALDIAFLDAEGVVLNIERGLPGVERPGYHSTGPARFVLEMDAGWCAQAGLQPGDRIEISEELRALAEP